MRVPVSSLFCVIICMIWVVVIGSFSFCLRVLIISLMGISSVSCVVNSSLMICIGCGMFGMLVWVLGVVVDVSGWLVLLVLGCS